MPVLARSSLRIVLFGCLVAALIAATSAQAAKRHVAYGKPGNVQVTKIQGQHDSATTPPVVIFPTHLIRRTTMKAGVGKTQKVCIMMQIWVQVGNPPTAWTVKAHSKNYCTLLPPGTWAKMGQWNWTGTVATPYHAEYVVTWSTKKRKLAKATYDFNVADDYQCLSLFCLVDTDPTTHFPYISFDSAMLLSAGPAVRRFTRLDLGRYDPGAPA